MRPAIVLLTIVLMLICAPLTGAAEDRSELLNNYLEKGDLWGAEKEFGKLVAADPKDEQARFALAVVKTMRAVEARAQEFYKYGPDFFLRPMIVPGSRLPVEETKEPEKISYAKLRRLVKSFVEDLDEALEVLDGMKGSEFRLNVRFGMARMDLDGDGEATDDETLWKVWSAMNPQVVRSQGSREEFEQKAVEFVIGFDAADAHWLRAYLNLISGVCEAGLAHDSEELFNHTAQLFFPNVDTPYPYLQNADGGQQGIDDFGHIADIITFIHLYSFECEDPELMKKAHSRLLTAVGESRETWHKLLVETDNVNEWIPNPNQTAAIPGARVTEEMADSWLLLLDEVETLLKGEKLIPFWRGNDGRGVNLKKVFTDPTRFDLVKWIQGTGADPYLEQGTLTEPDFWNRIDRVFSGEFLGFAVWVN